MITRQACQMIRLAPLEGATRLVGSCARILTCLLVQAASDLQSDGSLTHYRSLENFTLVLTKGWRVWRFVYSVRP